MDGRLEGGDKEGEKGIIDGLYNTSFLNIGISLTEFNFFYESS